MSKLTKVYTCNRCLGGTLNPWEHEKSGHVFCPPCFGQKFPHLIKNLPQEILLKEGVIKFAPKAPK